MNAREFEIVWGLAMLLAAPILGYILKLLSRFFSRRRRRTADDGAAETQAAAATTSVDTLEATATSLAETTARLAATVTLFNNRVTAEQPWEEPVTAIQVEEASTLIPSDSATSSTATCSHSLQNHMPSREYADNIVLLNPQSHFPLIINSAAAATTSLAIPEATATSLAETSTPGLEGIATLANNGVTAEKQREEPATARQAVAATTSAPTPEATTPVHNEVVTQEDPAISRQVEEALTLVPSHAANASNPATSTSPTHVPGHSQLRCRNPDVADTPASRDPQSPSPLTNRLAVAATTSAPTPEATAPVHNEVVTQEDPAISRQVEEALTLVPSHAANSSNPATSTSPTHVPGHSQLRCRNPDVADTPASRDPQSPSPLTNRLNQPRSCKSRSLLAVGVMLLVGVWLLVVNPGTASLKFWNVPRQAPKVDAATRREPEVATIPVGGLPPAPTSLHFNGIDGRKVVFLFPAPGKPIFVLSPEVQKVPRAYMETWFRAVESLLMMVRSRELDLHTRDMDSVKENLFQDTLGQKTEDHNTCSGDQTDCDNMNQIKMGLCGFSNVPRQASKVDAATRGEPAVSTPPVGLPVAPTSLHFNVGGRGLDFPFPSSGKPIFVLGSEVQEVSRAYVETWFQAVESLLMMVCSYGSSNAWRDRFIGLRPRQTFCFCHSGMAISPDPPQSNPYPPQIPAPYVYYN